MVLVGWTAKWWIICWKLLAVTACEVLFTLSQGIVSEETSNETCASDDFPHRCRTLVSIDI